MNNESSLKEAKIGVCFNPYNPEHPAFRRRIGYYLKSRGLRWERADFRKSYDVVLIHHSGDLTKWKSYNKGKVVLDYNDDYLAGRITGFKGFGRGLAKFVSGRWSSLVLNYKAAYKSMIQRADAIVCCTEAQRVDVLAAGKKVFRILDMQSDANWRIKGDYVAGRPFNIVWEGLPMFDGLRSIRDVIRKVGIDDGCALHLVTALVKYRHLENYWERPTKDEIARALPFRNVWLYEWNSVLFTRIVTACDLGVIPIDMGDPLWVSKPANKLLFFWRMGMPVLVSRTPAYQEMMEACGLDMTCGSQEEWLEKLQLYMGDGEARRAAGERGLAFAQENYSEEKQLAQWDEVLRSVL